MSFFFLNFKKNRIGVLQPAEGLGAVYTRNAHKSNTYSRIMWISIEMEYEERRILWTSSVPGLHGTVPSVAVAPLAQPDTPCYVEED